MQADLHLTTKKRQAKGVSNLKHFHRLSPASLPGRLDGEERNSSPSDRSGNDSFDRDYGLALSGIPLSWNEIFPISSPELKVVTPKNELSRLANSLDMLRAA